MADQYMSETNNGNMEIDLLEIVRLLISKIFWLILAGLLGGVLTYLAVYFFVDPTYKSRVSYFVYNTSDSSAHAGTITTSELNAAMNLANTYAKIMSSNSVVDQVIEDLGDSYSLSRGSLKNKVSAAVVSNTQLLEVVVTTTDPEMSYDIAKAYARVIPTEIVRITKAGSVEVVDQPEIAKSKSGPNLFRYAMIGAVAGALILAAVYIIMMLADTTVYLAEDIELVTDIPVLGQIPNIVEDSASEGWEKMKGGVIRYGKKEQG